MTISTNSRKSKTPGRKQPQKALRSAPLSSPTLDDGDKLFINSNAIQILMLLNQSRTLVEMDLGMLLGLADVIRSFSSFEKASDKHAEQRIEKWRQEIFEFFSQLTPTVSGD